MSYPKLERAKQNNPGLSDLLDRLMAYIERQRNHGQTFFLPKLAAAYLGLKDGEAYVLLELLVQAGILKRVFNVYCRETDALLATVANEADLDDISHCDECDLDHGPTDVRLEIAFEMNENGAAKAA